MADKEQKTVRGEERARRLQAMQSASPKLDGLAPRAAPFTLRVQHAVTKPASALAKEVLAMQSAYGNRAVLGLLSGASRPVIQPKLGEPVLHQDDDELVPGEPELHQDDDELVPGEPELHQDDDELVPGEPELHQDDDELVPGEPELHQDDDELVPGEPELHQDNDAPDDDDDTPDPDAPIDPNADLIVEPLAEETGLEESTSSTVGGTDVLRQVQGLELGTPGDKYEREADRVADQVVQNLSAAKTQASALGLERGSQDAVSAKLVSLLSNLGGSAPPAIARSGHGTANLLRVHALDKGSSSVMREVPASVGSRIQQSKGQGSPLPAPMQQTMGAQFGHDFSQVRVKSGEQAAGMSQQLGARAFTHGSDIWLGHGESVADTKLLAHELTHVVQQGAAPKLSRTKGPGLSEAAASSGVLQHLQRVARGGAESKPYREAISRFRREHNGGDLATLQRKVLEPELARDIAEKDTTKSVRMAICGGGTPTFPTGSKIRADSTIKSEADTAWQETKDATTRTQRREQSFWIRWNSDTKAFSAVNKKTAAFVANDETASVRPGAKPADSGDEYTVACFHTHTPTRHRAYGRGVGPSGVDINVHTNTWKLPGLVYDYKAVSGGNIPARHPLNSAAKIYLCGTTRRE